jgi:hypothetical protein
MIMSCNLYGNTDENHDKYRPVYVVSGTEIEPGILKMWNEGTTYHNKTENFYIET